MGGRAFEPFNVPVACGGAVVCPGDVVIGDTEGLVVVPRLWASEVARAIGAAGHPEFAPETITQRLKELAPDAPVLGMDSVHKAVADRNGVIIDGTFDETPGPDRRNAR